MPQEHVLRPADGAGFDQLFETLSHPARRRILESLRARERRGVQEFASGGIGPDGTSERRAEISLHHKHLPQLDDAGYVRWDREAGTVARGANFDEFRSFAALLDEHGEELALDWSSG